MHANQARSLQATLDQEPFLADGGPLPPLWHWIYFHDVARASRLGPDGHPERGGFLPPVPLPRRMWAGGRLRFEHPLLLGRETLKTSEIVSVSEKSGRSGDLCFVTVRHVLRQGEDCVIEEHDIVYRSDPEPDAPAPKPVAPPEGAVAERIVKPDPTLLFRYSALTFNGHRIHYDRDYARDAEGYPGLIVHGPLIATLLAGEVPVDLRTFEFRAIAPLFDMAPFSLHHDGAGTSWATNPDGHLAMRAHWS